MTALNGAVPSALSSDWLTVDSQANEGSGTKPQDVSIQEAGADPNAPGNRAVSTTDTGMPVDAPELPVSDEFIQELPGYGFSPTFVQQGLNGRGPVRQGPADPEVNGLLGPYEVRNDLAGYDGRTNQYVNLNAYAGYDAQSQVTDDAGWKQNVPTGRTAQRKLIGDGTDGFAPVFFEASENQVARKLPVTAVPNNSPAGTPGVLDGSSLPDYQGMTVGGNGAYDTPAPPPVDTSVPSSGPQTWTGAGMADLDIAGHKVPKWAAIAAGAGGVGAVYLVWRNHQATADSSSASSADASQAAIDPATGYPEGSAEDEAALAQQDSGYGTDSGYAGTGIINGDAYDPATGAYDIPVGDEGTTGTINGYSTNAQWSQAVQSGLTSVGYTSTDVSGALGAYLAGQPLTSAQVAIVNAALAEYGPPPTGTFTIVQTATTGPTSTTKTPGVPSLSATPHAGYADFGWSSESGATGYELVVTGAGGKGTGTSHFDQTVTANHVEKLALAPGKYVAYVRAQNSAGASAYSAHKTFTVSK